MSGTGKICPKCNRMYDLDRRFCEQDGAELTMASPQQQSVSSSASVTADRPRRRLPRETIAGGLIVLALIVIVTSIFAVRQAGVFRLRVVFDEAHGLKVGDSVFVRGADVGEVVSAQFDGGRFIADVTIRQDGADQLKQGSLFFVGYDKVFMNRHCIAVLIPDPAKPPLQSGDEIRGVDSWLRYYAEILKTKGPAEAFRAYNEIKDFVKQAAGGG